MGAAVSGAPARKNVPEKSRFFSGPWQSTRAGPGSGVHVCWQTPFESGVHSATTHRLETPASAMSGRDPLLHPAARASAPSKTRVAPRGEGKLNKRGMYNTVVPRNGDSLCRCRECLL